MSWRGYDYRAIVAGTAIGVLGTLMTLGAKVSYLACDRATARCTIARDESLIARTRRGVPLASLEGARKVCRRPSVQAPCRYTLEVLVAGRAEPLLDGIDGDSTADELVGEVQGFVADSSRRSLEIRRDRDRFYAIAVVAFALIVVALGVRKNLVDKGRIG
jgi:hypothetical protein